MRTTTSRVLLLLVPTTLLLTVPAHGAADRAEPTDRAERILELTNRARAEAGCPRVRLNPSLTRTAQQHSTDMARHDYLGHIGSRGADHITRARRGGYPSTYVGENVAAGNASASATFTQWSTSRPHRKNIVNCSFTELGVGHAANPGSEWGHYWTQLFGSSDPRD
ncbi:MULTISPECIES: CAP domain-containing protein [unclassified Actinopolyspora]|uniref:CAP domain-containing protein n=1 Tax=unclassified Actinopolyspora TaxID=2639451 RepID=UPI0013F645F8|nr:MULTISPECIES: CAP domain-containing protein [unclassified Actinopolyspora]NHD17954.1 CAP domain-containing protein [Actinopolyspora sp. BKK2]NHE77827.1 CAP domain-containing protein [Actinopolyspora sp. BKK1]